MVTGSLDLGGKSMQMGLGGAVLENVEPFAEGQPYRRERYLLWLAGWDFSPMQITSIAVEEQEFDMLAPTGMQPGGSFAGGVAMLNAGIVIGKGPQFVQEIWMGYGHSPYSKMFTCPYITQAQNINYGLSVGINLNFGLSIPFGYTPSDSPVLAANIKRILGYVPGWSELADISAGRPVVDPLEILGFY